MPTHSPICDAGASTGESAQGSSLRDDSSRPEMAQSVLVRQTVGTTSRLSFGPATEGRSTVPAPQPPETPISPGGVPTRLEAVPRVLHTIHCHFCAHGDEVFGGGGFIK